MSKMEHHPEQTAGNLPIEISCSKTKKTPINRDFGVGPNILTLRHVGYKIAEALGRKFLVYDASKAMFEDVLGYPNVEKLKHGVVEYISSPVINWDKELVLIDELNRALPELQSKWLEIIPSRRIMGFPTTGSVRGGRSSFPNSSGLKWSILRY